MVGWMTMAERWTQGSKGRAARVALTGFLLTCVFAGLAAGFLAFGALRLAATTWRAVPTVVWGGLLVSAAILGAGIIASLRARPPS